MPYIKDYERQKIYDNACRLIAEINSPGQLNYAITTMLCEFLQSKNCYNYDGFNMLVGVLECVKLELYRRAISPYEDKKCAANGDVYGGKKS